VLVLLERGTSYLANEMVSGGITHIPNHMTNGSTFE
jgi:hypothetical protein